MIFFHNISPYSSIDYSQEFQKIAVYESMQYEIQSLTYYVVLHDSMLELMQQFNKKMECLLPGREYFFVSRDNTRFSSHWLTDNFRIIWDSVNSSHATAYDLRHNYAIEHINRWTDEGFNFYDKIAYLSKSMGHVTLESTKYYYSIVPNLSSIMEKQTNESFDWIVPEVNEDEEIY